MGVGNQECVSGPSKFATPTTPPPNTVTELLLMAEGYTAVPDTIHVRSHLTRVCLF